MFWQSALESFTAQSTLSVLLCPAGNQTSARLNEVETTTQARSKSVYCSGANLGTHALATLSNTLLHILLVTRDFFFFFFGLCPATGLETHRRTQVLVCPTDMAAQ